ncbi:hypothetical protein G5V58_05460 [Nocardioides anomalus]|uniref:Uncharacterized protein n=1 Tax=Nocardioides anomalus TaxID=2712223 RepID=A0A6G6WAP3_9ACTN|nr:hypothetical protein [Nocardioides anomalus]QIG42286.1 hypothetical protein G5V58_05460 [Nocardioides anomalus]
MGFSDSLKKWATSRATELLTADGDKRADAAASADAASAQAKSDLGESLVRAAFPKLGQLADEQEARRTARAQAEVDERRDEIAALPLASVQLSLSGHTSGSWSGRLHYAWHDEEPGDADPADPYADQPLVWFELFAEDTARPEVGGLHLTHWGFQLPGYHGDGTYDLTAIAQQREAAGAGVEYLDWVLEFADHDDAQYYFWPDAPPSSVTVADSGRTLVVSIGLSGASGGLVAAATITLPAG